MIGCSSFVVMIIILLMIAIVSSEADMSNKEVDETSVSMNESKTGLWTIENKKNNFNEPTSEKYVFQETTKGLFSNSATTDSKLTAEIIISVENICIRLKEYGHYYVKNEPYISFYVKGDDGDIKTLERNYCDNEGYIYLEKENADTLMNLMLKGGTIKFHGWDGGVRSTYNFSFNSDKLTEALIEIGKNSEQ